MTANVEAGRHGRMECRLHGTSDPYINIPGIVDIGVDMTRDELECTTHDDGPDRNYIHGHRSSTIPVSGRFPDLTAGLTLVLATYVSEVFMDFRYWQRKLSNRRRFSGKAFVTAANPNAPLDDTGNFDYTLRVAGPLTIDQEP